ncbi:MAG: carbon-nitrogen hydrolase family protein [Acidobacteriota bacterium]|nr:MAG: carbon-nitrogen hydrolase family protein [Acidobacteriota bacterium]
MKLKIAVVQFRIRNYRPEENLKRAEKFVERAKKSRANIVVFPEDFVTGPIEKRTMLADPKHEYRKFFQRLARRHKIDVVPGSVIEKDSSKLHNTAYYIASGGKVLSRYRKVNLWHPERKSFTPGRKVSVFGTRYGKVGLVICWDLIFPEIFRKMAARGVEIVICPSYWLAGDAGVGLRHNPDAEVESVDSLCVGRAFENEIILVFCNAAGRPRTGKRTERLIGHSQIAVPFKGAVKRLPHNREAMFVQEVDTAILKDAERAYKIREDLKKRAR